MRRTHRILVALAALAALAAACGGGEAPAAGGDDPTEEATLIGRLGGDAELEGGCAWLEPVSGPDADIADRVEPLWPEGYRIEFEPELQLVGPEGDVVAERGELVAVVGAPAPDRVSICQVGPIYAVEEVLGRADDT